MQTEGRSRGQSESDSQNTQRLGRELMTPSELATMPGDRCILQLRGLPPFYSKKYDLKQHPNYKYTAEADKVKNAFDLNSLVTRRMDKMCIRDSLEDGQEPEWCEGIRPISHGGSWMPSIGQAPDWHDGSASLLWQTLEDNVPTKYFLSPAQCSQFLRLAEIAGCPPPAEIEALLLKQGGVYRSPDPCLLYTYRCV